MKTATFTLIASAAALTNAQMSYNRTTGAFTCAKPGAAYCAGDSLKTDIIIRCGESGVGQPGRCSDVSIVLSLLIRTLANFINRTLMASPLLAISLRCAGRRPTPAVMRPARRTVSSTAALATTTAPSLCHKVSARRPTQLRPRAWPLRPSRHLSRKALLVGALLLPGLAARLLLPPVVVAPAATPLSREPAILPQSAQSPKLPRARQRQPPPALCPLPVLPSTTRAACLRQSASSPSTSCEDGNDDERFFYCLRFA